MLKIFLRQKKKPETASRSSEPKKVFAPTDTGLREGIYSIGYHVPELGGIQLGTNFFIAIYQTTKGKTLTTMVERLEYGKYVLNDLEFQKHDFSLPTITPWDIAQSYPQIGYGRSLFHTHEPGLMYQDTLDKIVNEKN